MLWMNESEIDQALDLVKSNAPEYLPYVKFLSDWRDTVNQNSDGWAYWKAGSSCASTLSSLIMKVKSSIRGRDDRSAPSLKELNQALTPIKSCATRHKLPVPVLGEEYKDVIKDDLEFVAWIEGTLIPDFKDDGAIETAADFERLVMIIRRLTSRG